MDIGNSFSSVLNWGQEGSIAAQIFLGLAIVFVIYIIVSIISYFFGNLLDSYLSTPKIINGLKSASSSYKLSQNPKDSRARLLRRSSNQRNGIEFTYMTWMFIDGWEGQSKKWKHVLHKGPVYKVPSEEIGQEYPTVDDMTPPHKFSEIQAPGIWMFPDSNKIRIYMNTFNSTEEFVDIDNIPISKWFHLSVVLSHRTVDVYFNGVLKERLRLSGVPKQNYYDIHVSRDGGFQGYLSDLRYFNYAIRMTELMAIISKGPNLTQSELDMKNKSQIPYLSNRFWFDDM